MFTSTRRAVAFAAVLVLLGLAACGGTEEQGGGGGHNKIVVWTGDTIPDRVDQTKDIIAKFTESTGIQVELVGVDEDQFNQLLTSAAAAGELPDVIGSQPLAAVRTLSANDLLNSEAAAAVIETLGADTFSAKSLELTRDGDEQLSVPTDAWSQLLYYRKDLFEEGGPEAPADLRRHHGGGQGAGHEQGGRVRRCDHRPVTRSPSRRSSISRWATAARWSTTRRGDHRLPRSAWRRSSSTAI